MYAIVNLYFELGWHKLFGSDKEVDKDIKHVELPETPPEKKEVPIEILIQHGVRRVEDLPEDIRQKYTISDVIGDLKDEQ